MTNITFKAWAPYNNDLKSARIYANLVNNPDRKIFVKCLNPNATDGNFRPSAWLETIGPKNEIEFDGSDNLFRDLVRYFDIDGQVNFGRNIPDEIPPRLVFGDCETTGLHPTKDGDRIISFAFAEVIDGNFAHPKFATGFINPEGKPISDEAKKIHGITDEMAAEYPQFTLERATKIRDFIGESPLVFYNRSFDMKFINSELSRVGIKPIHSIHQGSICAFLMAKEWDEKNILPNKKLSTVAEFFGIDTAEREKMHGARRDTELLIKVFEKIYLETRDRKNSSADEATNKPKSLEGSDYV